MDADEVCQESVKNYADEAGETAGNWEKFGKNSSKLPIHRLIHCPSPSRPLRHADPMRSLVYKSRRAGKASSDNVGSNDQYIRWFIALRSLL